MHIDTQRIIREFEANPIAFMAAAGGLFIGMSKIIESVGNARGSHAFARDARRREKQYKQDQKRR